MAKKLPDLKELGESLNIPKAKYLRKPELIGLILAQKEESKAPEPTAKEKTAKASKAKAVEKPAKEAAPKAKAVKKAAPKKAKKDDKSAE